MPAKARVPAAVLVAGTVLIALTSCLFTPTPAPTPTPTAAGEGAELIGTSWDGTDSEGDDWSYTFEEDGTLAVTLNGEPYDDDQDVWTVSGTDIVLSVNGGDQFGEILHTGQYAGLDEPMNLDVRTTVGERTWTVTLERQE